MFVFKRNQIIITALVFMVAIAAYLNFTDQKNMVQPTFEEEGNAITQNDKAPQTEVTDYFLTQEFDDIETLAPDNMDLLEEDGLVVMEDGQIPSDEVDLIDDQQAVVEDKVVLTLKDKVVAENKKVGDTKSNPIMDNEVVLVNKNYDINYFVEAKMDREQKRSAQIEMLTECVNNQTLDKDSKANAAGNLITLQERIEKESAIESLLKAKGFKEVFVRMSDTDVDVVIDRNKLEDSEIAQIEDIVRRKTGYTTSQIRISPLKN